MDLGRDVMIRHSCHHISLYRHDRLEVGFIAVCQKKVTSIKVALMSQICDTNQYSTHVRGGSTHVTGVTYVTIFDPSCGG